MALNDNHHDEPRSNTSTELPDSTAHSPCLREGSAGTGQESRARDMMVEALQHNVDELKRVNKNLRIDVEGQALEIEKLGCQRWWLIFLVILLLGTALFFTARWVIAQVETAEHDRRIGDLQVKKFRTIEEAAELAWRRENWPAHSVTSWKRTYKQYYARLSNKKVIDKWASIDVGMIYKPDGQASCLEFYFLEKDTDRSWKVIRREYKDRCWDDCPSEAPVVPEDIRKQLGW
jgi:hypothetical protein